MPVFGPDIEQLAASGDVEGLIKALGHRLSHVREAAVNALTKIGAPAVQPLARALGKGWPVSDAATEALKRIRGPEAALALVARQAVASASGVRGNYCDICGGAFPSGVLTELPLLQLQQAVRAGFNPYETPGVDMSRSLAVGRAKGLSGAQLFPLWRQALLQDSTDWKLCRTCLAAVQRVASQSPAGTTAPSQETAKTKSSGHYILECRECEFAHHIPREFIDSDVTFSVDVDEARMVCVYGPFTVTLEVKDFFRIKPVPEEDRVLRASIGANMKPLHAHMLSHCSPLFLIIDQSSNRTTHEYKKHPAGNTYVKFSREHGADIVGNINLSRAEIPGVSD